MDCDADFDLVFVKGYLYGRYLTHYYPVFPFYTPWQHTEIVGSNGLTEHHSSYFFIFLKWVDSLFSWQEFGFLKLTSYSTHA